MTPGTPCEYLHALERYSVKILTDTSTNEDGDFDIEDILRRSAVGTINTHGRKVTSSRVDLDEVTAGAIYAVILFIALQRGFSHGGDHLRASTDTLSQSIGPIADLTDVDGDVGILGGRGDGELKQNVSRIPVPMPSSRPTGCHCKPEISGTWMNNHWPATYLKLGLIIRSSMAPRWGEVSTPWKRVLLARGGEPTYHWGEREPSTDELHAWRESHAKPSLRSK